MEGEICPYTSSTFIPPPVRKTNPSARSSIRRYGRRLPSALSLSALTCPAVNLYYKNTRALFLQTTTKNEGEEGGGSNHKSPLRRRETKEKEREGRHRVRTEQFEESQKEQAAKRARCFRYDRCVDKRPLSKLAGPR